MRTLAAIFIAVLLLSTVDPTAAQTRSPQFEVEVEPVVYLLGGAGGHVGMQRGAWTYTVEVFHLTIPESMHGNDGFDASPLGVEFHLERFFGEEAGGFYAGPEAGLVRFDVTHRATGARERRTRYSVGVRGGYRWYTGLGNLYLSPVVGLGYTLNGAPIDVAGETFESGSVTPWGTVGIGWSFGR